MADHEFTTAPSATCYRNGCRCDECKGLKKIARAVWESKSPDARRQTAGRMGMPIGSRFAKMVTTAAPFREAGVTFVTCLCDCGKSKTVRVQNLKSGGTRACGCGTAKRTKDGLSTRTPGYKAWEGLKRRCCDSKHESYKHYGARGIRVCDEWRESFAAFYRDMGPRPSTKHSIERMNNDGNYEPSNCRWATPSEQAQNTQKTRWLTFRGERLSAYQWAKRMGWSRDLVGDRVRKGWSVERAILTPPRGHH